MVVVVDVVPLTGTLQGTIVGAQSFPGALGATQPQPLYTVLQFPAVFTQLLIAGTHQYVHEPLQIGGGGGGGGTIGTQGVLAIAQYGSVVGASQGHEYGQLLICCQYHVPPLGSPTQSQPAAHGSLSEVVVVVDVAQSQVVVVVDDVPGSVVVVVDPQSGGRLTDCEQKV